jgi:hypothetical protein
MVGAQRMGGARPDEALRDVLRQRILRSQPGSADGYRPGGYQHEEAQGHARLREREAASRPERERGARKCGRRHERRIRGSINA